MEVASSPGVFIPTEAEPTYHLLAGYDRRWLGQVREGIRMASRYWGSYGPARVWVVGVEDGDAIGGLAKDSFLDEYCRWRIAGTEWNTEDCREHAAGRFIDVAERGESEAYLSWVDEFERPEAELVFINVHRWFFAEDPIPDPVLRGIHEYTHVCQMAFGTMPTWLMEGGAVFSEGWIPWVEGRVDREFVEGRMMHLMDRARGMDALGLSIADMEDIDDAPARVRRYHRELAYDAGAWAFVHVVHQSPSRSVSALRDEFFPMIAEDGWETVLVRYLGLQDKEGFYDGFALLMAAPRDAQRGVLRDLLPKPSVICGFFTRPRTTIVWS